MPRGSLALCSEPRNCLPALLVNLTATLWALRAAQGAAADSEDSASYSSAEICFDWEISVKTALPELAVVKIADGRRFQTLTAQFSHLCRIQH